MSDSEGHVTWDGHRTWYRRRGEAVPGGPAPIVLLHGGPGGTHDYLEPLLDLGDGGRPVVLYDQLGNGRSDHLRDAPVEFWTVDLFKRELTCLLEDLGFDGPLPAARPVVGRDAGARARARPARGPRRDGRGGLAGEHAALGRGGQPPAHAPCRPTCRRC